MNVGDRLSGAPVFLDTNFRNCEIIIKVFTSPCKCPNKSMIKPSEIQLNQESKPFYIFRRTFMTTERMFFFWRWLMRQVFSGCIGSLVR